MYYNKPVEFENPSRADAYVVLTKIVSSSDIFGCVVILFSSKFFNVFIGVVFERKKNCVFSNL